MPHQYLDNMKELLCHHYNEAGAISRAAAAAGFGLDPYKFAHPYPGSTNITNIYQDGNKETVKTEKTTTTTTDTTSITKRRCRWLPWALLLLALLLVCASLWLWWNMPGGSTPPSHEHDDPALLYEVWERDGDGPWKRSTLTVEQLLGKKLK